MASFMPRVMASLSIRPVSSAIPNRPESISASTSSDVCPMKASSKSWMMTAPFIASAVTMPRSIRSTSSGPSPTFTTWAPMPTITGRLDDVPWRWPAPPPAAS